MGWRPGHGDFGSEAEAGSLRGSAESVNLPLLSHPHLIDTKEDLCVAGPPHGFQRGSLILRGDMNRDCILY